MKECMQRRRAAWCGSTGPDLIALSSQVATILSVCLLTLCSGRALTVSPLLLPLQCCNENQGRATHSFLFSGALRTERASSLDHIVGSKCALSSYQLKPYPPLKTPDQRIALRAKSGVCRPAAVPSGGQSP